MAKNLHIRTNWPVTAIEYSAGGALVRGPAGAVVRCRYVVVTASLRMLQLNQPSFVPPLPAPVARAVQRLRMSNAIKVVVVWMWCVAYCLCCGGVIVCCVVVRNVYMCTAHMHTSMFHHSLSYVPLPTHPLLLTNTHPPPPYIHPLLLLTYTPPSSPQVILAFAQPIWPVGFFDVVCLDSFIPEFWVTRYTPNTPNGADLHGMTGFLAGAAAEVASVLGEEEILSRTLAQLDAMFGMVWCVCVCVCVCVCALVNLDDVHLSILSIPARYSPYTAYSLFCHSCLPTLYSLAMPTLCSATHDYSLFTCNAYSLYSRHQEKPQACN